MALLGLIGLLLAFAGVAVSILCLLVGQGFSKSSKQTAHEGFSWAGHIATYVSAAALTFCCALLVYCFMTGDTSLEYVVKNQSNSAGVDAWLYKLAGLWGGREGSLLFWAWLIAVFGSVVALKNFKKLNKLDNMAVLVIQLVLIAFVGVLLFSDTNMPFVAMDAAYFDAHGHLTGQAALWGMNTLLEHWAMAIHPPTLFIGYAGLTVPFAYAIAALIVNDPSRTWVDQSKRYTMFSWFFLSIGIGLGAVWAYVVLGWGGYWGWDPVENASLLSWLIALALIHSFTVYQKRNAFKRWSVMCACLTFAFVIVGTFITRSGIVQSVHAFDGDSVSIALFLFLIVASVLVGIIGLLIRWKSFGPAQGSEDDIESIASRDATYYLNNVIMVVVAFLLLFLTISSALPSWIPFGGEVIPASIYNAIARPLGILYCLLIAVCPLLSWRKTEGKEFWKKARVPGLAALILFAVLLTFFFMALLPSYQATIAAGGSAAETLSDYGPSGYYNGLAVFGLLVASLLFFNAFFLIVRTVRAYAEKHQVNAFVALARASRSRASFLGGSLAHLAMGIILIGLIGSSMYVTEKVAYLSYDEERDAVEEEFIIQDYRLLYKENDVSRLENETDIVYELTFEVYKGDNFVGTVSPSVQLVPTTQQQKLNAAVLSFPTEDLFVVYRGVNQEGAFSLDVRVNPLVSFVWVGFALLMVGMLISLVGKRKKFARNAKCS